MKWQAALMVSMVSGWLCAQTPPPVPPPAPAPAPAPGPGESKPEEMKRVDQRAEEMREQIDKGKTVKSHVKVAARLKNGNKLIGVVKDGRLIERVDGLRFVDAQARERGAGIRLWYSGGTRNYVFVPFADLRSYEVLQRLSNKQLQQLEEELQMAERTAAERAAAEAAKAAKLAKAKQEEEERAGLGGKGDGKAEAEKKPAEDSAEEAAKKEQQAKWAALLAKYPPQMGWNQAKRDEISRRFVVIGARPSPMEQAFVDQFEDWLKACQFAGLDPNAGVEEKAGDNKKRRDRPSRRDR